MYWSLARVKNQLFRSHVLCCCCCCCCFCVCLLFLRPPAYDFEFKGDEQQEINSPWPNVSKRREREEAAKGRTASKVEVWERAVGLVHFLTCVTQPLLGRISQKFSSLKKIHLHVHVHVWYKHIHVHVHVRTCNSFPLCLPSSGLLPLTMCFSRRTSRWFVCIRVIIASSPGARARFHLSAENLGTRLML